MTSSQPKIRPSITAHRQFPAFTALWCAALFGLGSLALQPALLESIVSAAGLPALVPAAAPPLGSTARILVSLILTIFGFGFGLLIGLRLRTRTKSVAQPRPRDSENGKPRVRSRDAHPDAPPRKPLILSEDLMGEMPSDGDDALPQRRRALLADQSPSDPEEWAPLPGENAFPFAAEYDSASEPDPFEEPTTSEPVSQDQTVQAEPAAEAEAIPATTPHVEPLFAAAAAASPANPRSPVADMPIDSLGLVQLIERLALAIAERREHRGDGSTTAEPAFANQIARQPILAPLQELNVAASATPPVQAFAPAPFAAPTAPVPHTSAGPFHSSNARASAIAAWELGEEHDAPMPEAHLADAHEEPSRHAVGHDGYSSLLEIRPTAPRPAVLRQEFVPVEPDAGYAAGMRDMSAQAAASDSADTDRALHDALATLRRMTAKG